MPYLIEGIGITGIFLICTISIAVHMVLLKKLAIESFGKSNDQIEADFLGVPPKRRSHISISRSHQHFDA